MSLSAQRATRLKASRQADSERKLAQVQAALGELERSAVSFSNADLARVAKVSRRFLYDHPETLAGAKLVRARTLAAAASGLASGAALTMASLRADLANSRDQNRRLRDSLRASEARLAELLGAEAAAGVGWVPPEVQRRLDEAEAERAEMAERIRELEEELEQVRRLNRELMAQVNRAQVAP